MSVTPQLSKCPKCGQSVPDWAQVCQFCGTLIPGRAAIRRTDATVKAGPRWQDIAYMVVSAWWVLQGIRVLLVGFKLLDPRFGGIDSVLGGFIVFELIVGGFLTLVGVGLLLKIEVARGITNILCWLQIASSAFSILGGLMGVALFGVIGLLFVLLYVIDFSSAIFMVYLLGETDARAS